MFQNVDIFLYTSFDVSRCSSTRVPVYPDVPLYKSSYIETSLHKSARTLTSFPVTFSNIPENVQVKTTRKSTRNFPRYNCYDFTEIKPILFAEKKKQKTLVPRCSSRGIIHEFDRENPHSSSQEKIPDLSSLIRKRFLGYGESLEHGVPSTK